MERDISYVDYLNNSGTRGSEPLYKTVGMSVKRYRYTRNKNGTFTMVRLDNPKYKIIKII